LAEQAGVSISHLTNVVQRTVEWLGYQVTHLVGGVAMVTDFFLDILIAWLEQTWVVVGLDIFRVVSTIILSGNMKVSLTEYAFQLGSYIKRLVDAGTPTVQVDVTPTTVITSIFVSLVGSLTGVCLDSRRVRPIPIVLVQRMTTISGVSYFVQILNFVTRTFSTLRDFVMEALGYVSPEPQALR